ncbi:hypothetical protein GQ457_16G014930 [Hibiscus cannabinus]
MVRTLLLDIDTLANHLGLEDEGVEDETTQIPFVHAPGSSMSILDAHDRILHLLVTWWFRPFDGKWSSIHWVDTFCLYCFCHGTPTPLTNLINEKSLRKSKFQLIHGEWIRDPNA